MHLEFDQQPQKGWGLSSSPRMLVNSCTLLVYYGGQLLVAVENWFLTLNPNGIISVDYTYVDYSYPYTLALREPGHETKTIQYLIDKF